MATPEKLTMEFAGQVYELTPAPSDSAFLDDLPGRMAVFQAVEIVQPTDTAPQEEQ